MCPYFLYHWINIPFTISISNYPYLVLNGILVGIQMNPFIIYLVLLFSLIQFVVCESRLEGCNLGNPWPLVQIRPLFIICQLGKRYHFGISSHFLGVLDRATSLLQSYKHISLISTRTHLHIHLHTILTHTITQYTCSTWLLVVSTYLYPQACLLFNNSYTRKHNCQKHIHMLSCTTNFHGELYPIPKTLVAVFFVSHTSHGVLQQQLLL